MNLSDFEDIRSYNNDEIPAAMRYFAKNDVIERIAGLIFPNSNFDDVKKLLLNIKTTEEFQEKIMKNLVEWIITTSMNHVDTQGFESLDKSRSHLFVGNHRDITVDAFLLQYCLLTSGHQTTNVAFGNNLVFNELTDVFCKVNKMFQVQRSHNIRELAKNSQHLSDYIRYLIRDNRSVWIAQRNGRTKNGDDKTDHGIITMFSMSGNRNDMIDNLLELNITPVATSYEFEPCAMMKARERYITERDGSYTKSPSEDYDSVMSGITKKKGIVNVAICNPITHNDLQEYKGADRREVIQAVANIIDKRIYENYRLYPNNFIAHDWLSGASTYKNHYAENEENVFKSYCDKIFSKLYEELGSEAEPRFKEILLGIYANPVENIMNLHR